MAEMTTDNGLQMVAAEAAALPAEAPARVEALLLRLEEQSALQTRMAKKRLFWARLTALAAGVMAAAVVVTAGRVIPQAERVLSNANTAILEITTVANQLEMADIPALLENLDRTLTESRENLTDAAQAVEEISTIDFDALNQAILDLQKLVQNPLGALFSRK